MASGRTGCRSSRSPPSVTVDSPFARCTAAGPETAVESAVTGDKAAADANVEAVAADPVTGTLKPIGRPLSDDEPDQRTIAMPATMIAAAARAHRAPRLRRMLAVTGSSVGTG